LLQCTRTYIVGPIMALWPVESLSLSERLAYTNDFKSHHKTVFTTRRYA